VSVPVASGDTTTTTTTLPTSTINLGATGSTGATGQASGTHTYVIQASDPNFTDTGLSIPAGATVSLSVTGNATCHEGGAPDCPIGNPSGVYTCANNPYDPGDPPGPAPSLNYGSLDAKFGARGEPFVVGPSKTVTDPVGGELYLVFNDCYGETTGHYG